MTATWRSYVTLWLAENQRDQAWLARNAGMRHQSHLTGLMKGRHIPQMGTLLRLEKAMGLRPETLVRLAIQEEREKAQ